MSLRLKDKVKRIRRSLSWHNSQDATDGLDGLRGSVTHSSNNSFDHSTLPPGWESAIDNDGRVYYINHNENISTYNDPRQQLDVEYEYAETRIITLKRDPQLGFGFVAGSERPVVVRCVTEHGPSDQLLLPGDQIHKIDSEDVRDAPRSRVIELVRSAADQLVLTVSQPPTISTQGKKSILLNAAKKQQKLKRDSSATRVRFSEESINIKKKRVTTPAAVQEVTASKVLKVYLETDQTRSFKYDGFTLVKDVLHALQEKQNIRCIEHFGLVLHNTRSPLSAKMVILSPLQKIKQVVEELEDEAMRCIFRIVYVPRDAYDLLRKDSIAFQYFYVQCCQDVINERFSSDLKCDVALRLASLHMQEYAIEKHVPFHKISIKLIEREFGLGIFLNPSMLRAVRPKELRKMLSHFMKLNQGLIAPGQKQVTPLQAKLHYMKIVSELRSFGGKCFLATLVDRRVEVMLLVGPKCGISQVTDIKSYALHMLADFDLIERITVQPEQTGATQLINVLLTDKNLPTLALSMMNADAKDFLIFVQGYHQLFCGAKNIVEHQRGIAIPPQSTNHNVVSPSPLSNNVAINGDQDEHVEPDYATIEDILLPNGDDMLVPKATLETDPLPMATDAHVGVTDLKQRKGNVLVATVRSTKDMVDASSKPPQLVATDEHLPNHILAPSASTDDSPQTISVSDESDGSPPPTSSIDDLINSSPESSLSSPRDPIPPSTVDGLTDECITELSKLDEAGVLLNPNLFKDKGVYLNPQAEHIGLVVLPPPPDTEEGPVSPPAVIPPPPELFTDSASAHTYNTDREMGVQLEAIDAINVQDGDKESGIDSDDSGTETLNSTADNTPNMTPHSAFDVVAEPPRQQMPVSSLRSIMQEQRAKDKLAKNTGMEQLPIFYTPVKPTPIQTAKLKQKDSEPIIEVSPTTHSNGQLTADSTPSADPEMSDIDSRIANSLMQLTNMEPTATDESDTSESDKMADTPNSVPPMMVDESQVEVSTEEEDNVSLPPNGDTATRPDKAEEDSTEPMYMNSEIDLPVLPKLTSPSHAVAANAIDEALDGLSSDDEGSPPSTNNGTKVISVVESSSKSMTDSSSSTTEDVKKVSATIAIKNSEQVVKPTTVVAADEPTPTAPPRRRRGMKSSPSLTSISVERPASRASITTIGSSISVEDDGHQVGVARQTSLESSERGSYRTTGYHRSVSNTSALSEASSDKLSTSGHSLSSNSPRVAAHPSNNPISGDLSMLQARAKRRSKQDRLSRTASVIGAPTNITCTAGDVLANCVPIVKDEVSPRPGLSNVKVTSRDSLLDEIVKNAEGLGIDTLGLSSKDSVDRASLRSNNSSISSTSKLNRPAVPPPQPPQDIRSSKSEGDLLSAVESRSPTLSQVREAMLEVEYTLLDNKGTPESGVGISRQPSVNAASKTSASLATNVSLARQESTLDRATGLVKEGSFIKFSGYSGEPSTSPVLPRKGRFRKSSATSSVAVDHIVGENQNKRGIMAKILSTLKPRKRSMSLDKLNSERYRKVEGGSLKLSSEGSRPTILPSGNKTSAPFRSLGRSKFHPKPKLSASLTDLVQDSPPEGAHTSSMNARSHSIDCLLGPTAISPAATEVEEEVEELLTSGDKITPAGILNYTYETHNAFQEATAHTKTLTEYFIAYCDTQWAPCLSPDPHHFTKIKETLISDARQFVSNSKHLVAGVAQATSCTDAILVSKMAASVRTLAKIIQQGVAALKVTASEFNMTSLRECVVTVSEAYYDVLETSHKAAGKGIQDENMMMIMQKASHLASLLSLFLKTLRSLHESS